ncbi:MULTISPECIES: hypothetical protein [Xanthobacter]|uniref:F0F1-type ATP synthase membrane subunit c/vacuolar-type H+-ATPase subunit K n=1 Tax=Xanthobacter flavus TaxID=281 RepID=A0A9W6CQY6_XANFL|nr:MULTISPECIES: hypothetical protein [Xanthobacter]MBN8915232.1 hypothetical protein [Hyphomicrobiales bacterium]MDR6331988.1 F0F1-type ATP synthase membrane subunit c/vacuolar-type H+-ATPase subunit K [Xanthobacter flavus]UJX45427.1 hypothetical protein D7006_12395 [Xanthobacter sp. YC-JY1]GLI22268.1 hypothetical protein XFLAVUS301_19420 [Xanthobacter flavus]
MSILMRTNLMALGVAVVLTGGAGTGNAAAIGTGALAMAPAKAASVTDVGYWYRGRYYRGGCWNCGNGAALGAGVAIGVLGAAAIAGAAAAPPPPPVVYYEQPPVVYYQPAPRVYLEPVPPPRPRSCWVATGPGGQGYFSPC